MVVGVAGKEGRQKTRVWEEVKNFERLKRMQKLQELKYLEEIKKIEEVNNEKKDKGMTLLLYGAMGMILGSLLRATGG